MKKINILLNFATVKKGGGQNVALNFINSLGNIDKDYLSFIYVVVRNSDIHIKLMENDESIIVFMPENPLKRMYSEFKYGASIVKKYNVNLIYTYFGIGLYPQKVKQVSGSADSNIFFPEINFWSEYTLNQKIVKYFIDQYRIWGLKRAYAIIFENESMMHRGKKLYNLKRSKFIKPSVDVGKSSEGLTLSDNIAAKKHKAIFLCGWQRNKNYMIIPRLAKEFKEVGIDFHFILTANPDNSTEHKQFTEETLRLGVEDMITILGAVKKSKLKSLYEQVDFVFLLSKLESFSNNIIESWYFNRALVITDAEWSRSICKNAAIYVERDNPAQIVSTLLNYINDRDLMNLLKQKSKVTLSEYPSIVDKTAKEILYLKEMHENS